MNCSTDWIYVLEVSVTLFLCHQESYTLSIVLDPLLRPFPLQRYKYGELEQQQQLQ